MTAEQQTTNRAHKYSVAVKHLRSVLAHAEIWPSLQNSRDTLEAGIAAIERARSDLHGSLWILLLGGTGVGKSTLLDALAGSRIAPASVKRPTTTRTTFYAHAEASLAPLGDIPPSEGELTTHDIEVLRDKVVIDPPDFDSSVEENRRRLMPLLEAADLVIAVVDREKYRDEQLFELLGRFHGQKSFLFVANKSDQGFPEEVFSDFNQSLVSVGFEDARILRISALEVLNARLGGKADLPELSGEFDELEDIIERELDRARIREIKSVNLSGLASHVVNSFRRAVGDDAGERVEKWLASCRNLAQRTTSQLRERFATTVLGAGTSRKSDALRAYLHGLQLLNFGGVFGAYLGAAERIRAFLGKAWARPIDEVEARVLAESRARGVDRQWTDLELNSTSADAAAQLTGAGLGSEQTRARVAPATSGLSATGIVTAVASGAGEALSALTRSALSARWYNIRNLLYNLLPTLIVVGIPTYAVMAVAMPLIGREELLILGGVSDGATLGVISLAVVCFLQKMMVERVFARGSARALTDIENNIGLKIDSYMTDRFVRPCELIAEEARGILGSIDAAQRELDSKEEDAATE